MLFVNVLGVAGNDVNDVVFVVVVFCLLLFVMLGVIMLVCCHCGW